MIKICLILSVFATVALANLKKLDGKAVDISAKGDELWMLEADGSINRWNAKNNGWEKKPGSAVSIGAANDGWTWVVNRDDAIFRFDPNSGVWERIPGGLIQINALSKDKAIGVNRAHDIYLWDINKWVHIPGKAKWACLGENDDRWVVNAQSDIYRWNHVLNTWDKMPGRADKIDCQSGNKVIVSNDQNQLLVWTSHNWHLLPNDGKRGTVNHRHIFTLDKNNEISVASFPKLHKKDNKNEKGSLDFGVDGEGQGKGHGKGHGHGKGQGDGKPENHHRHRGHGHGHGHSSSSSSESQEGKGNQMFIFEVPVVQFVERELDEEWKNLVVYVQEE